MYFNELKKEAFFPHTINEIMDYYHLTIKDISSEFQIPYRTVQNWAGGISSPPHYIIKMIWTIIVDEELRKDYRKDLDDLYDQLDQASDLLHDQRFSEAIDLINNL